jgi:SPP1 gp7 family putative phage head morphogenesis protein
MTYVADYMTTGKVGDRRIDDMTHETEQRVQTALFAGMEQQEGQPQLALRVQALFDDMSEGRARVIAKSETVDAYNQATLQQGKDAGSTLDLMWIATGDDSTRPEHEAMDGVQVPHDQEFECEDGTTMPGEAVNCRCCLGYAQPEE